jgi:hypothetical protein
LQLNAIALNWNHLIHQVCADRNSIPGDQAADHGNRLADGLIEIFDQRQMNVACFRQMKGFSLISDHD